MNFGFRTKRGTEPPLKIILVRPGATDFDDEGRILGRLDVPLNARGIAQAEEIAKNVGPLTVRAIYAAPELSSAQTAEIIGKQIGISIRETQTLQNLHHGLWQGRCIDDVRNCQSKVYRLWQEQPENVSLPEGEMISDARNRAREAFDRIAKKHDTDSVVVVLLEPIASIFRAIASQTELGDLWAAQKLHGTWEIIDLELVPVKVKVR